MANNLPSALITRLNERKENKSLRLLDDQHYLVDFYSNDYLGLGKWESSKKGYLGSTGSRLISGNLRRTEVIEHDLATFFNQEASLFFNSGYDANLGFFSCVPQKGDTVLYDQFIHASVRDGLKLGLANAYSFKHNNLQDLKNKLKRATGTIYIAIESVYSMDGDFSPLNEIVAISESFNAFLIVDEAHAGGVFGSKGEGLVSELGLDRRIFAKIITFGKAYGSHGAIVLGDKILKDYLINFSRPLIYTTALPPHALERIFEVVQQAKEMDSDREILKNRIAYFKAEIQDSKFETGESNSPIQLVYVSGNDEAKSLANKINQAGFAVKAILHPTVALGCERLRICIHSFNTEDQLRQLAKLLKDE